MLENRKAPGASRDAISKRVRFSVLKRDGFACYYCGRRASEVKLEIDHVVSVMDGGTNDINNLRSSCQDCNRGKAATSLDKWHFEETSFQRWQDDLIAEDAAASIDILIECGEIFQDGGTF